MITTTGRQGRFGIRFITVTTFAVTMHTLIEVRPGGRPGGKAYVMLSQTWNINLQSPIKVCIGLDQYNTLDL